METEVLREHAIAHRQEVDGQGFFRSVFERSEKDGVVIVQITHTFNGEESYCAYYDTEQYHADMGVPGEGLSEGVGVLECIKVQTLEGMRHFINEQLVKKSDETAEALR